MKGAKIIAPPEIMLREPKLANDLLGKEQT